MWDRVQCVELYNADSLPARGMIRALGSAAACSVQTSPSFVYETINVIRINKADSDWNWNRYEYCLLRGAANLAASWHYRVMRGRRRSDKICETRFGNWNTKTCARRVSQIDRQTDWSLGGTGMSIYFSINMHIYVFIYWNVYSYSYHISMYKYVDMESLMAVTFK